MESQPTWAEVDLRALSNNVKELRRITSPEARLMAVVKADAYGHGALEVANTALENGADFLAVARLDEALYLRKAGVGAPILVLGYTPPEHSHIVIEHDLLQTVYAFEAADALSSAASRLKKKAVVHIKIDTGMGRLGLIPDNPRISILGKHLHGSALRDVESIAALPNVEVQGMFTHFASADSKDKSYAFQQMERFLDFLDKLKVSGIEIPIRHAANSAALIDLPETHLDMVRPGISLYGFYPSAEVKKDSVNLIPAMSFKTRVVQVKRVPAGFPVSYGMTYQTEKPTVIATVSVGYADGLNRLLSSRGKMLVKGMRADIAGRVCMDLTLLDVGHIPDVGIGDEVVIFGRQGQGEITVDEIAESINTINYEIVTSISSRVKRYYLP